MGSDTCTSPTACAVPKPVGGKRAPPNLNDAYDTIASAPLKTQDGKEIVAKELWQQRPALILIVRRPGCIMCRQGALALLQQKTQLESLGIDIACVFHEFIPEQVTDFAETIWPCAIYHDETKAFYKAMGSGTIIQKGLGWMLNPFSAVWRRAMSARRTVSHHNVVGDGSIMGGLVLVKQGDAGLEYLHVESDYGMQALNSDILQAAKKAAAATAGAGTAAPAPAAAAPDAADATPAEPST